MKLKIGLQIPELESLTTLISRQTSKSIDTHIFKLFCNYLQGHDERTRISKQIDIDRGILEGEQPREFLRLL